MPTISQRGIDMPASPIRKLVPLANRAKAKGTVVYHLNIGQPDLATPEVALRAAHHLDREVLEYSPSEGILSFRKKLVEYYHKFNIDVCTDDIIITTGGSEAVFFSFMACLDPGDEIIVPEPAYANYMAFAISCGAVIKTISSTIDEGFALPSVEKFEALITPRTKAILICNPNNPTGYPKRNEPDPGFSQEIRPVPVFRRSIPGILLHRCTLYLGFSPRRYRKQRHSGRFCLQTLQ